MRKGRKVLIILSLGGLAAVCIVTLKPRDEPKYQGRYLSDWLEVVAASQVRVVGGTLISPSPFPDESAELAVQQIGTNALPYYLKWMRYERATWRITFAQNLEGKLPDWVIRNRTVGKLIVGTADRKSTYAFLGIKILGTNAASAMAELETMMKDRARPQTAGMAIFALSYIGGSALPVLKVALGDTNQIDRPQIVWAITLMQGDEHRDTRRAMIEGALTDEDLFVRKAATNAFPIFNQRWSRR